MRDTESNKIRKDQRRRFKSFVKSLEQISSRYGVAIDTIDAAYVLDNPQKNTYEIDDNSGVLESVFVGKNAFI